MSFWKALFPKKYLEKQLTQKNEDHIDSGMEATISDKFSSFLEGDRHGRENTFKLPQYEPAIGLSVDAPLVCLDILGALLDNYWRARLLLYETARQARPLVSMLGRKSFKLDPVWVPLDRALAAMLSDPFVSDVVGEGLSSAYCKYPNILQDELGLSRLREKHKNMILADPKIVKMTAATKATFLRLDKEFRETVIGPLKDGMINGKDINCRALEGKARSIHTQAKKCCDVLRSKFIDRQESIVHMALKEELRKGTGPQPLASSDT